MLFGHNGGHDSIPWPQPNVLILEYLFPMRYSVLKMKIICKICTTNKFMYQLNTLGPIILLVFHLSGLGF
jgi:hypothetical protein